MSRRRSWAWLAWCVAGVSLVGLAVTVALAATKAADAPVGGTDLAVAVFVGIFVAAFATVGALVASRQPGNAVGWIMVTTGLSFSIAGCFGLLAELQARRGGLSTSGALLAWISSWAWIGGFGPSATVLLLVFPDGRVLSRRWRYVVGVAIAGIACLAVSTALRPGNLDFTTSDACTRGCANPFALPGAATPVALVGTVGGWLLTAGIVGAVASLAVRFIRARREERLQLKWLLYAVLIVAVTLVASLAVEVFGPDTNAAINVSNMLTTAGLSTVPIAIGVAVLRYRLYDIDLIVNRTLVYGSLSAILSLVYVVGVTVLQRLLSPVTGSSSLAVAGSTLAAAALFRPVQIRVQSFIDRRFYRRRYDATRTLATFSSGLRVQTDVGDLSAGILRVVNETVQPAITSLWLRPQGGGPDQQGGHPAAASGASRRYPMPRTVTMRSDPSLRRRYRT